jgi:hypothetical protein
MMTPAAPTALNLLMAPSNSASSACWTLESSDKATGLVAHVFTDEAGVERALHARFAAAVEVGVADDVRGEAEVRVEALGLAVEGDAWLAERIDGADQLRKRAALQIDEGLRGAEHPLIIRRAPVRHQRRKLGRQLRNVADQLLGMHADRPAADRARQRDAVAVDDVGAGREQGIHRRAPASALRDELKEDEPSDDQHRDAGKDQHHQHQPMIGERKGIRLARRRLHSWSFGGEAVHRRPASVLDLALPLLWAGLSSSLATIVLRLSALGFAFLTSAAFTSAAFVSGFSASSPRLS